jgi:hypothetical protein
MLPMVLVEWWDHYQPAGPAWWNPDDVAAIEPSMQTTVGYLVHHDEHSVIVVSTVSPAGPHDDSDLYGAPFVMVAAAIKRIIPLFGGTTNAEDHQP